MKVSIKTKKMKCDQAITLVLIGLFLVPIFVREMILPTFYQINIFAFLGCLLIVYSSIGQNNSIKVKSIIPLTVSILLLIIMTISEIHAGRTFKGYVRVFAGLLMPLFLLYYTPKSTKGTIRTIVIFFNIASIIIVAIGLIDFALDHSILSTYFTMAKNQTYLDMLRSYSSTKRLFSFLGHPLYNAEIFLITFGLHYLYNELFLHNHKSDKWILIVTMIGIALTASKSAIALFLMLLCILYIKNPKYTITALIAIALGYSFGVFDLVILRFSGSLTTGRSEVWSRIRDSGVNFFHIFWGNGSDSKYNYAYLEAWARAAFEYPYRLFALEFGILFCTLMMWVAFIYPLLQLLKNGRNWIIIIVFVAVVAHINMYNGIGTYSDHMYMYSLFGCVILNMDRLSRSGEIKE